MKALNSSVNEARRAAYMTGAGMLLAFLLFAPVFASATSYTLSVKTDKALYNSGNTINVSGSVSPAPSAGTAVGLKVTSSAGTLVDINQATVGSNGTYSATFKATYPAGAYTITASWAPNASATAITATANFQMNGTTSTSSVSGVTTTVFASTTTTIIEAPVTTTVVQAATTTVVQAQQTTTTVISVASTATTVTESPTTDSTALAVGAIGVIIAIIAIVLSVLTMRKK